ncbi:Double-stranded RNA-binding protein Staufen -like protein 2 [Halotydeus destructor]|nr:Double-stranded RNA-binding protein Staufen -like protein 2 [Halotydeus destructor]
MSSDIVNCEAVPETKNADGNVIYTHQNDDTDTFVLDSNGKSPMCLVNELARFNRITHQYQLIDESGPPHKKNFAVVLKIGDVEQYEASGTSIRKAQHAAALIALRETQLPLPPEKSSKSSSKPAHHLTPTVELNCLATRLGQAVSYSVAEPKPMYSYHMPPPPQAFLFDFRGMHNQRYHYPRSPFCATVTVGERQFTGRGKTDQSARHSAAEEALKILRTEYSERNHILRDNREVSKSKSCITEIYEVAFKMNLQAEFTLISEGGPSHLTKFVTRCTVGDMHTEAEGHSKKISKNLAAEKMLELVKSRPSDKREIVVSKKGRSRVKPKMNVKDVKLIDELSEACDREKIVSLNTQLNVIDITSDSIDETQKSRFTNGYLHPVNQLIEYQIRRKSKEPQFATISEKSSEPKKHLFEIECTVEPLIPGESVLKTVGCGRTKKDAKKISAQKMLSLLNSTGAESVVKVSHPHKEQSDNPNAICEQLAPGLLRLKPSCRSPDLNFHMNEVTLAK